MKNVHIGKKILVSLATVSLFVPVALYGVTGHARSLQDAWNEANSPANIRKSREQGLHLEYRQGLYAIAHPEGDWTSGGGYENGNDNMDYGQPNYNDGIKAFNAYFHTNLSYDSATFDGYIINHDQEQKINELEATNPDTYTGLHENDDINQSTDDNMNREVRDSGVNTSTQRDPFNVDTFIRRARSPLTHHVQHELRKIKHQRHGHLGKINLDQKIGKKLRANPWAVHYVLNELLDNHGRLVPNITYRGLGIKPNTNGTQSTDGD